MNLGRCITDKLMNNFWNDHWYGLCNDHWYGLWDDLWNDLPWNSLWSTRQHIKRRIEDNGTR